MSKASLELGGGNWAAKDGKLLGYAVGDTSGKYLPREFTFSRGADIAATRVNKDGLIEKYRENLIKSSNDFTATGWTPAQATLLSGYSGYDGTNDAWFLRADSSTFSRVGMDNTTSTGLNSTGLRTFSVYAKKKDYDYVGIYIQGSNKGVVFSLLDGTAVNSIISYPDIYSDGIEVGGGWWRFSISHPTITSTTAAAIYACEAAAYNGNSNHGKGIYIQDAQFEYGLVATGYLESDDETGKAGVLDNLPRIDYTSGSAQLLMEPARTNYLPHSEYLEEWQNLLGATLTVNAATAPDGTSTATSWDSPTSTYRILRTVPQTLSASTNYVFSFYAKNIDADGASYRVWNNTTETNVITATSYISQINTSDWTRIEVPFTTSATPTDEYSCYVGSSSFTGEILFWGAQLEEGSYATSYIPTYGAQDTRDLDYVQDLTSTSSTGITNNYNTTVFFDGSVFRNTGNTRIAALYSSSVAQNPRVLLYLAENSGNHKVIVQYRVSGQTDVYADSGSGYDFAIGDRIKMAMRLDGTSLDLFVNGVKQSTATIVQGDPIEVLRLKDESADLGHFFNDFQVFSSSLSDAECIALTTL